jgi:hypothetical protein
VVRQSKTGATVRMPCLPELLDALRVTPRNSIFLIVSETTSRPYAQFNFVHRTAEVIAAAGIVGKRYGDLRRSAVVRLVEAGCTIPGDRVHHRAQLRALRSERTTALARAAISNLLKARAKT